MTTHRPTTVRIERERSVVILSGIVMAFVGLAMHAMSDDRLTDFLSSAMVLTGVLMALPQLVARALTAARGDDAHPKTSGR